MHRKRRSKKHKALLRKKIVEYYFDNPHHNGYKVIEEKFDVDEGTIRKALDEELQRRFNVAESCRKHI
jgi:hypothetical protein|tara:strand:+ start:715 stop:918 length:204 start_codon:yes stop_codon:yes gene_type:complete